MKKTFTAPEMSISKFDCENIATTGSNIGTTAVDNVSVKLDSFARQNNMPLEDTTLLF